MTVWDVLTAIFTSTLITLLVVGIGSGLVCMISRDRKRRMRERHLAIAHGYPAVWKSLGDGPEYAWLMRNYALACTIDGCPGRTWGRPRVSLAQPLTQPLFSPCNADSSREHALKP